MSSVATPTPLGRTLRKPFRAYCNENPLWQPLAREGSLSFSHIVQQETMSDRSEYFRRYYQDHREEILAKKRAHYHANKERISLGRAAYQRSYWHRVGFLKRLNRIVDHALERFHATRRP